MDDSSIIELYWQRSERAIVETDGKYGAFCRRIALNILRVQEDAEECVNDTWHSAWRSMPPERPDSLRAFLGRITRNLSLSRWRASHAAKRGSGAVDALLSELGDCIPAPGGVEERVELGELSAIISRWLEGLDADDRALFIRRYWFGDAVKTLAAECGVSANSMAQRMSRLRSSLRTQLEAEGVEL